MIQSKRSILLTVMLAALVAAGVITHNAHAGAKCPNRYFKKVKASGVGDSEANATQAYKDDVKREADKAKGDCDNQECEETGETCTFRYTYKTKPKCKAEGPGFKCSGWMRPGCFCMEQDEDSMKEVSLPPEQAPRL